MEECSFCKTKEKKSVLAEDTLSLKRKKIPKNCIFDAVLAGTEREKKSVNLAELEVVNTT